MNQVKGISDAMFDNVNRLLYRLICVGENDNDKVHEMYLCRVEIAPRDCQNCTDAQITGDYLCTLF
uniref:Putative ovule protein n=1 Tax=Solanum chacoense TaxID=4108 RepID=A0A0V0GVG4_SOLCH